jgi:signal transduction histidine kinase
MVDGALRKPEDFAGAADIIHGETERMIRLVNNLLDLSKLESGQIQMAQIKLDLKEILGRSIASLVPRAEEAKVKLVSQFEEIPPVIGDPDRLRQVFNNLIDNGLKYTPPGGKITVGCFYKEGNIKASVTDTGSGIPSEDLSHIFERFYQANKSRSREVGGVGLGLSITREIISAHGGRIEAQSKLGAGTRFIITLPAILDKATTQPIPNQGAEREKVLVKY